MLNEVQIQVAELKGIDSKKFCIGLPSTAVFDQLLEYLSPEGKCSNVVYHATAKKWADDFKEVEPGKAEWRDSEAPIGRPANFSQANELFLVLVRLCLNLKEYDLAKRFEISQFLKFL